MKTVVTLFLCVLLIACAPNYSNGSRVGVVTKLSNKGLIWKSWEGEMIIGGVRSQADEHGNVSMVANIFAFNVDPSVVDAVSKAQQSGRTVELVYRQWALAPWTIENDHVVVAVKQMER